MRISFHIFGMYLLFANFENALPNSYKLKTDIVPIYRELSIRYVIMQSANAFSTAIPGLKILDLFYKLKIKKYHIYIST